MKNKARALERIFIIKFRILSELEKIGMKDYAVSDATEICVSNAREKILNQHLSDINDIISLILED